MRAWGNDSMNIGMVCHPSYGGSGVVATELAKALAKRGHHVHLIAYDAPVRYPDGQLPITLHTVDVPQYPLFKYPPYLLALANKIVEVARTQSLDVLHVHYAIPHATAGFLAKSMLQGTLPLVTTLHGTDITLLGSDPSFFDVIRFSINQSDAVTAVSETLRRDTLAKFDVRPPIECIYNFVDPQPYAEPALQPYFLRRRMRTTRVVIHISNFRQVKRVPLVVELFARATQSLPAVLWLVGDGPDAGEAHRTAVRFGVAERVKFWGKQDNPIPLLAQADVMVLPSTHESFGLAALEAMACGVPVLATDVGGVHEVVEHGKQGYLFPPDAHAAMADCLRALLEDPALRQRLGEAGRERAMTRFSGDRIVPRYEAIYRRVVAAVRQVEAEPTA